MDFQPNPALHPNTTFLALAKNNVTLNDGTTTSYQKEIGKAVKLYMGDTPSLDSLQTAIAHLHQGTEIALSQLADQLPTSTDIQANAKSSQLFFDA